MIARRILQPAVEPVSLSEAKSYLKITDTSLDSDVSAFIASARIQTEAYTDRTWVNTTWRVALDSFPEGDILLPYGAPLVSVTSITYVDESGSTQTWASTEYTVETYSEPGRIALAYGKSYPSVRQQKNAVTITYVAGYGADASNVPADVKTAIKMLVAHYDQNRGIIVTGTIVAKLPETTEALLSKYRVGWCGYGG